ncbi:MAG: SLC13 family permease, partial [Pyramidobacter sp.]|nr:SLC13 family permease [Pyramidobacter sp.]
KLGLRPLVLLLLVSSATGVMNLVPWGGPTIRAATAIHGDANQLWLSMIPMQAFGMALSLLLAVYLGRVEKRRLAAAGADLAHLDIELAEESGENADVSLKRPKLYAFNVILTVLLIAGLIWTKIPAYVIFLFGCVIALAVNYPDLKEQQRRLCVHAPNCIGLTMTLLCAGIFLGVFANTGMITQMAKVLIDVLPAGLQKYLHLIIGALGAPLGMIMGPDPYYYAVLPLIGETVAPHGVTLEAVARAMLIGENVALSVSPCVATTFLAIGLVGAELKDHIRFSFVPLWGMSLVMLIFAWGTGIV